MHAEVDCNQAHWWEHGRVPVPVYDRPQYVVKGMTQIPKCSVVWNQRHRGCAPVGVVLEANKSAWVENDRHEEESARD